MFTWGKKNLKFLVPLLLVVVVLVAVPFPKPVLAVECPFGQVDVGGHCVNPEQNPQAVSSTGLDEASAPDEGSWFWDGLIEYILLAIFNIVGLILGLAGMFLNFVIQFTIVEMKQFIDGLNGINIAWTVIRDIANILFVFILLFIGISTILGSWFQSSFTTKIIPKVILAALLINFSLFFTKAIIDVSNIVTYEFYKVTASLNSSEGGSSGGVTITTGFAGAFMQGLSLSALNKDANASGNDYRNFRLLLSIVFTLVAAFVFFVIAFMLIVRFVMFIFLMFTSPIAFIGDLLPQLKTHSDNWWKALSAQATFAPIFMVLALVVILIINDPAFSTVTGNPSSVLGQGAAAEYLTGLIKTIMQYCIAMFLLVAALVAAKQTAGKVGSGFVGFGEKLAKAGTQGLAFGAGRFTKTAVGLGARESVGRVAKYGGEKYDKWLANNADRYKTANKFTLGAAGALDRGLRKKVKDVETSKFGTGKSFADAEKINRERLKDLGEVKRKTDAQEMIDDGAKQVDKVFKVDLAGTFNSADKVVKDYLEQVGKMSNAQLDDLLEHNLDLLKQAHFAMALTPKQMDYIKDSKLVNQTEIDSIKDARTIGTQTRIKLATDKYVEGRKIASGKPADVANMDKKLLTDPHVAAGLSPNSLKEILSNDKLDPKERDGVKQAIMDRVNTINNKLARGGALTDDEKKEVAALQKSVNWLSEPDNVKAW